MRMVKSKDSKKAVTGLPPAPLIYVSDPTSGHVYVRRLKELIPNAIHLQRTAWNQKAKSYESYIGKDRADVVVIIGDTNNDNENDQKIAHANSLRSIGTETHFITVNIMSDMTNFSENQNFGVDHLNIAAGSDTAIKIYKWLFTVLTVRETLHLIPDEQMKQVDNELFPDYAYCPVGEARMWAKDVKVQFVVLIMTKPQVVDGKKLTWTVADKTGIANFYFRYRGASSQDTWDWVLGLKPGDRKALPRMPMVQVKEKRRVRLIKAPLRATAAVVKGSGLVITAVGHGVRQVGKAMAMGPSSKWLPEADVGSDGERIDWTRVAEDYCAPNKSYVKKSMVDIFNEKGERNWGDDASVVSTNVDSEADEKIEKVFG